jgi:CspA family cold shock protein
MTGTVKTLTDKGFGFISIEGSKKDMFFHAHELKNVTYDELEVGDELEFEVEQGEKGKFAVNIDRISQ